MILEDLSCDVNSMYCTCNFEVGSRQAYGDKARVTRILVYFRAGLLETLKEFKHTRMVESIIVAGS